MGNSLKTKIFITILVIGGFMSVFSKGNQEPFHQTVDYVDMQRFTGDWYVIALLPTIFEKGARNGIENYSVDDEGNITVRYTFNKGTDNSKLKVMYQKGWIYNNETNAEWRVSPAWPLKLPYYVMELADDYSYTVIGTSNFRYLWIMSRTPGMDQKLLDDIYGRMAQRGYDKETILRMEQQER